jgi:hypothetical protein
MISLWYIKYDHFRSILVHVAQDENMGVLIWDIMGVEGVEA